MLRWVSLRRAHRGRQVGGASATRGLGCGLGAVPFLCARGGGNDWWPLNRVVGSARDSRRTGWHCSLAAGWWAWRSGGHPRRGARRYRMEVEGGRGPRGSRGALATAGGRPRCGQGGAAPRLALFRVRRGRADSSRPVTVVGSAGAATARGPRGQVGAVWRTSREAG